MSIARGHVQRDRRALGAEPGGPGGPPGVLCPAKEGERNSRKEHLTAWLVSQGVLWLPLPQGWDKSGFASRITLQGKDEKLNET